MATLVDKTQPGRNAIRVVKLVMLSKTLTLIQCFKKKWERKTNKMYGQISIYYINKQLLSNIIVK